MNRQWFKPTALVLALAMIFAVPAGALASADFDGTQSGWAETELEEAYDQGLTYPDVMGDFTKFITREEFCTLAVRLYERLTGLAAQIGDDPFTDTDNPEILKAYKLGIVNGVSATSFAPDNNITRQEICVMIFRALNVSLPTLDKSTAGDFPFSDQNRIATWALEAMRFAYRNQIMKGLSADLIGPLNNTTREQAIVLLKRTFMEQNQGDSEPESEATIPLFKAPPVIASERVQFQLLAENSLAFPKYDERLRLYVSTKPEKPSVKPSSSPLFQFQTFPILTLSAANPATYTDGSYAAFVDKDASSKRWFAFTLNSAGSAKKVVWQVAASPFNGFTDQWRSPLGLLGSGEVDAASGEFQVDFSNLKTGSSLIFNRVFTVSSAFKPIEQKRTTYYVRAVPVDSGGNPIGDPGKGMAVLYGERVTNEKPAEALKPSFEVWTPLGSAGTYSGENQDRPSHRTILRMDPRYRENRFFHFHGIDEKSEQVVVQVSTEPFPSVGGGWPETPGIIYEKTYDLPAYTYVTDYPNSVFVDFSEFGKPTSEMPEGVFTKYYLRAVAIKDGFEPGVLDTAYSDAITIEYGTAVPTNWFSDSPYTRVEKLSVSKPNIRIKSYTPTDWPDKDYLHHYYVFREPKAGEILCNWKNSATGETLYPYFSHMAYYASIGVNSASDYENKMIPRVLPVNTTVYFPEPEEKDEAWYAQLYNGIVEFFEDLVDAVKTITNQVSAAYANLKTGLVTYVANLCPIESLRGPLKTALEGYVNYGLMAFGVPPTLPNFDQLSEMSMDYLTEVALTEAGIPSTDLTQDALEDIAEGIHSEMKKATAYADFNPVDAAFLKLDPKYMYRPAYVDVEVSNDTGVPSIAGTFDLNVTFEMTYYNKLDPAYGLFLSTPTNYAYGSDAALTTTVGYRDHFENGLNGDSVNYAFSGDTAVYDVFNPMTGIKVPVLQPGDKRTARIYLTPFDGARFTRYLEGDHVLPIDFENIYFNNGNKKFTFFNLAGRFPTAEEYLLKGGSMIFLDPKTDYVFTDEHKTQNTDRVQKSVNTSWSK